MKEVVKVKNLSKTYHIRENNSESIRAYFSNVFNQKANPVRKIHALKNISFTVAEGETLGIIGGNGSGKSTLINILLGSIRADKNSLVHMEGKPLRLALGMGFDPNLSARDNIYTNGSILGLSFKKIGQKFNDIIEFSGLEEFIETPVKYYSKGMRSRLTFSIAIHAEADILLLDEFFGGVGDENFKKKSDEIFREKLLKKKTIIIVSHSLGRIKKYSDRVIWLKKGEIMQIGSPQEVIKLYRASLNRKNLYKKI